ncbi:gamma-glutamylcyclotransferase family protein [Oceanicoccus sp. KOV_DT_Chl]|uniref:gamma-glutamylcyclotransferase family protein n=1 Tax=Oceanicoccus sp. KOV_DT_Chl TaxID=1904639 RepID=UPI000C7DE550|nr:gamma-glutamylcyclotransferase family protein [Oceanicoccus sp. KOV_DT_Chl]
MVKPQAFFIYGSLLDSDVRRHVFGRELATNEIKAATITGFQTKTYAGDTFPILVPKPDGYVQGAVLLALSELDLQRMDFFEGGEYSFGTIETRLEDGSTQLALYNQPCSNDHHNDEDWTLSFWQQYEKTIFLTQCERYMALFGKMTIDEADAVWRSMVDEQQLAMASN